MKLLKAKKALKRANSHLNKKRRKDWNDAIYAIKRACSRGKTLTSIYGANLTEVDKQKLEEKGYRVAESGATWYIYWGEYNETQS